ncbi:MutS like protein, related, partial [Eimeria tenella]
MGGKSTLLRQTALCVILAQVGSYVPASECVLTPVDRIFSRLGAEDFILQGSSTFFVELSDIAELTTYGTRYSLALIDELGRGTSTSDGLAIALSTATHIADSIKCRTLFATHYHMLCYELRQHPGVSNVHLGATVTAAAAATPAAAAATPAAAAAAAATAGTVSFEYKVREGICPYSHGLLVAKLAGVPQHSHLLQQQTAQQQRDARLRSVAAALLRAAAEDPTALECMYTRYRAE